jgi:hypothetical protein
VKSFEYEFRFLQAGTDCLESYLLSDELFWPVDIHPPVGEPAYPQLTLGSLLLSRARLAAYPKSQAQADQATQLFSKMDSIKNRWKVAWEKKAGHSFSVRLRMWRDYIEEYRNAPRDNTDRYGYEVRLRAMLTLLKGEGSGTVQAEIDLLSALDSFVRTVLVRSDFIWGLELKTGFPEQEYWYLYGKLPVAPPKS